MKRLPCFLILFFSILTASCISVNYESFIPHLGVFLPEDYFTSDEKILVLPLWHRLASRITGPIEPDSGYYYFDKPYILSSEELKRISDIIPRKKSYGHVTLSTASGKWDRLYSLILISNSGKAFYLFGKRAPHALESEPTSSWARNSKVGLVGLVWKDLLPKIILADRNIAKSQAFIEFSLLPSNWQVKLKKKLKKSDKKIILGFVEQINFDMVKSETDKWTYASK